MTFEVAHAARSHRHTQGQVAGVSPRSLARGPIGLVETFDVPEQDLFQIITQHDADNPIVHAPSYLGIAYSDDLTIIQLTVSDTRSLEQKRRLFARIAARLAHKPGLRPDDIFINLVEVKTENWSFGRGEAQYASGATAK